MVLKRKNVVVGIPIPPLSDISKPRFQTYNGGIGMTPKAAPKDADQKKNSYYRHGES